MNPQIEGMNLRDWFAGMALQGLLSQRQEAVDDDGDGVSGIVYAGSYISKSDHTEAAAKDAYEFAEQMLAAREDLSCDFMYYKDRYTEWERIVSALGDPDPDCSGIGFWADEIESHCEEIKKILKK
jgi:hypothetical protein